MVAIFKPIHPPKLKVGRIRLEALNGLRKAGRGMQKDFEATTQTWRNEKPTFSFNISLAGGATGTLTIQVGGNQKGQDKWFWLDEGTAVRYATMTPDFSPKTRAGFIGSGSGSGGVQFVNRQYPKPGIEARGWSEAIAEKWTPLFEDIMQEALDKGAALSGHSI